MKFTAGYFNPHYKYETVARQVLANVDYDTMVGQGLSGALVIPKIAEALGKYWLIVRKPGEASHSSRFAEGIVGQRWLFVDDLISSGATFLRVHKAMLENTDSLAFAGAYLYSDERWFTPESITNMVGANV